MTCAAAWLAQTAKCAPVEAPRFRQPATHRRTLHSPQTSLISVPLLPPADNRRELSEILAAPPSAGTFATACQPNLATLCHLPQDESSQSRYAHHFRQRAEFRFQAGQPVHAKNQFRGAGRYPRSRLRAPVQSRQRCHRYAVSVRPPWTTLLPGASSRASPAGIFADLTRDSDQRLAFQSRLIADATFLRQRYSRRSRTLSFNPAYSCSSSSTMLTSTSRRHQIFSVSSANLGALRG